MNRIVVTGASGYLGSNFCASLNNVELIKLQRPAFDLPNSIPPLIDLDYCIHFAALTEPIDSFQLKNVNVIGTEKLLLNLKKNSPDLKRFVYISTGGVYGYGNKPFNEKDILSPQDIYAKSKLEAEIISARFQDFFPITIIRPFYPFGRESDDSIRLINKLAIKIRNHKKIELKKGGRPYINPIYIDDFVSLAKQMLIKRDSGFQIYNIAGSTIVTIRELTEIIGNILDKEPVFHQTNISSLDTVGDITKVTKKFDFKPRQLKDGLTLTYSK